MVADCFTSLGMNCMNDDIALIDTNLIVYSYDTSDKKKHETCKNLVEAAFKGEAPLAVSNQILAETFFVLTQKLKNPSSSEDAEAIVDGIIDSINWKKINYTDETVKKAIILSRNHSIGLWDSLIAETSLENGIKKIYTENVKDFRKIPGLRAVNPFS